MWIDFHVIKSREWVMLKLSSGLTFMWKGIISFNTLTIRMSIKFSNNPIYKTEKLGDHSLLNLWYEMCWGFDSAMNHMSEYSLEYSINARRKERPRLKCVYGIKHGI